MWETRGKPQHFTYSKVMSWVAFDRVIKTLSGHVENKVIQRWEQIRAKFIADVCENGFSKKLNSFTQAYGSTQLDASLLLLPQVGFLCGTTRERGTIEAIEKNLIYDGFVLRFYGPKIPMTGRRPETESSWLAASGWLLH